MKFSNNILNTIGNTPLIEVKKVVAEIPANILIKNEAVNPSRSKSDRVVAYALKKAKENKLIREKGTLIIEVSASMAISFAMISLREEFQVVAVVSDKVSTEKIVLLEALGAQVVSCPSDLTSKNSRSKYAVAKRIHKRTSNSWLVNEEVFDFFIEAYYETLAKELWDQTHGAFQHLIVPVNTGSTIVALAKYIKEKNKAIQVWGIDSYGSVLKKYYESGEIDENEMYSYEVEEVGALSISKKINFSNIDGFVKVSDRESTLAVASLAAKEGLLLGMSTGACIGALSQLKKHFLKDDVVIIIAPDGGERYANKIYNKEWMRSRGFIERPISVASDLVKDVSTDVITVKTTELVSHAVTRMRKNKISQIPVVDSHGFVGSIDEMSLFSAYLDDHRKDDTPISEIMKAPFPMVNSFASVEEIAELIRKGNTAVIVALDNEKHGIITKSDVISHLK